MTNSKQSKLLWRWVQLCHYARRFRGTRTALAQRVAHTLFNIQWRFQTRTYAPRKKFVVVAGVPSDGIIAVLYVHRCPDINGQPDPGSRPVCQPPPLAVRCAHIDFTLCPLIRICVRGYPTISAFAEALLKRRVNIQR